MGFIGNYIDNRVINVLDRMNLNIKEGSSLMFDEDFDKQQNKVLYYGNTEEIIRFYKTRRPKTYLYNTNLFWRVVNNNLPIQHYPLANIVSKTMSNLVFSKTPRIEVFSGNKTKDKKYNEILNKILDSNNIDEMLKTACELDSYSGSVAFKINLDPEFSEYPILQLYPKEDIEVIKKYGKPVEVIFKDYYYKDKEEYVLFTIAGIGYIDYKLYKNNFNKDKIKEVPLNTLEETDGLGRIEFYNKDGTQFKKLLCVYKENKHNAESDYKNSIDDMAALDEIYSNMVNYIRKSKIKTYLPENVLEQNIHDGKKIIPNDYDADNIILYDSNPEGTKQEVKRDIVDIQNSVIGYQEAFNNVLLRSLSTVGLSPSSLGFDLAGANSSALALNIRERTSLRTRAEKIGRWSPVLVNLAQLLLSLSNYSLVIGETNKIYLDDFNYNVNVEFQEYESPTYEEQINVLANALNNNLIDLETALKTLYKDKTEDEIQLMLMRIEGQLPDGEQIVQNELNTEELDTETM